MDNTIIVFIFLILLQTFETSQLFIDDDSLMVVFGCGRKDLFKDLKGAWKNVIDDNFNSNCEKDPIDVLSLCKHAYPGKNVVNVAEMDYEVSVPHWCLTNDETCIRRTNSLEPQWRELYKVNTMPWKCLNSSYENKALPVPETCHFDHLSDMKICASSSQYINQARKKCEEYNLLLRQQSPLKSCGIGMFFGIEFVCCPANSNFNEPTHNDDQQAHNNDNHNQTTDNDNDDFNIISSNNDDDDDRHHTTQPNFIIKNHLSKHREERNDDDVERNDDDDENDDDDVINFDHRRKHHKRHAYGQRESIKYGSEVIDYYLKERKASEEREDGRGSEHQMYEKAKKELAAVHKRRLMQLHRSLNEALQRARRHKDPRHVYQLKRTINERFQKILEAEEIEHSLERLQLSYLHEQQVRKRMKSARENTMKLYLQTVDHPKMAARSPYKVVSALKRHIKILHKDRLHTIRHYKNTDFSYAETIREGSAIHIASLDKELAQALLLLDRLKKKTKEFVLEKIASSLHAYHSLDASFMVKVEKEESFSEDSDDYEFYDESDNDSDEGRKVKSGESVEETQDVVELKKRKEVDEADRRTEDEDEDEDNYSRDYDESMSRSEDEDDDNDERYNKEFYEDEDEDDEGGDEEEDEEDDEDDEEEDEEEDEEDDEDEEEDDEDVGQKDEEDDSYEDEDEDEEEEKEEKNKSVVTNDNRVHKFDEYRDYTSEEREDWDDDDDDDDDSSVSSEDADDDDIFVGSDDVDRNDNDNDGGEVKNVDDTFVLKKNFRGADNYKKDHIFMQQNQLHASKKFPSSSHTNFGTAIPLGVTVGTLTVAVVIIVGVLVMQRRSGSGSGSGYIKTANRSESDTLNASPEEKHLEGMQVNGYENPTYKYFERCQSSPPVEA